MILNVGAGGKKGNEVKMADKEFLLKSKEAEQIYLRKDEYDYIKPPGGSSGNISSNGINYSTEEQDTGLTWIDGKKIYQKSFDISNIVPINSEYVLMDDVDTLILHSLMFSDSAYQNGAWFILSSYSPIVGTWFYGDVLYLNSNNQLIFRIDGRGGILNLKGTIQYTKRTE